jgi:hypothetical protein
MPSPLENLAGPGKQLRAEAPDQNETEGLRLITAADAVARALQASSPP